MSNRIHQLPLDVANQIAAGEVVDRPANAVKELVENALDAGARRIRIDIESGGKKLIRVRDDGHGMSFQDAELCLQPHATSKIRSADDLWKVQTLGFRGEALPSLAAVSRLELTTREEGAEVGTHLVVAAGEVVEVREVGCAPGTEIVVRDLFFNTPARFKFLRSDAAEAARIAEMLGHLTLAYPQLSLVLQHNGREQLRVDGSGEAFNTLVAVLGRDTARQMLPITPRYPLPLFQVTGFIGRPQLTRANRGGQQFFVNGRLIQSRVLQHALEAAYEGVIHRRERHPVGVVFLQVAPGAVDVNVHPNKTEVRFQNEGEVHQALRVAVRDTLVGAQLAPALEVSTQATTREIEAESTESAALSPEDSSPAVKAPNAAPTPLQPKTKSKEDEDGDDDKGLLPLVQTVPVTRAAASFTASASVVSSAPEPTPSPAVRPLPPELPESEAPYSTLLAPVPAAKELPVVEEPRTEEVHSGTQQLFEPAPKPQLEPTSEPVSEPAPMPMSGSRPQLKLRPIAQVTNNSYLVCEGEDGLYIVNQHRAHERILADNTIAAAQLQPVESQRLVIPFTREVGARALAAVEEHGHLLAQLGFEVEAFGGTSLLVRAVPYLVSKGDYEQVFGDLLDELVGEHAGSGLEERRRELLTMLACKNAIKAGDPLPREAMQRLVDDLAKVDNPSICPHGQPILFKISSDELRRKFGREGATKTR